MTIDQVKDQIVAAVDAAFDDEVGFLQDLVRFPSVRGAEQGAQDFMAAQLRKRGYVVDRWRIDVDDIKDLPGFSPVTVSYENAINVVGAKRCEAPGGRSLILNGHIDVVPVGPHKGWTNPPFDPVIRDGWMYGRGSGDMKAGIASMVFALDALDRCGLVLDGDVYIQSVVEEECTGNGALACLQRGYKADAAIIPEPFNDHLCIAQIGSMWFRINLPGVPTHALEAGAGVNAVEAMSPVVAALHELEAKWCAPDFEFRHPAYADIEHPIFLNIGKIEGGDWPSSVPAWCQFEGRLAAYPGQSLEWSRNQIIATIKGVNPDAEIEWHGFMGEGYAIDDAHTFKNTESPKGALERAHKAIFGEDLPTMATTAATDARFFGLYDDTPALVYGPKAERIHGFDERVNLQSLRKHTKTLALFAAEWCGIKR